MLDHNDREKVEQYIKKIVAGISDSIQQNIANGMNNTDVIDSAIRMTVNRITPESKMILSSVYNMLMEKTLAKPLYQNPQNKAAFYSRDILKNLTSTFSFEVPNHIDYEETQRLINKWTASGAIVVAGGVVSITMTSVIPIAVAVVLAGIMFLLMKDKPASGGQDVNKLISDYLNDVKLSLMSWVREIEKSYDAELRKLEGGLS